MPSSVMGLQEPFGGAGLPPEEQENGIEGICASMPPLELMKLIIARAAKYGDKVMLIGVKKAHLYAPIEGSVLVDLPPERAAARNARD